MTPEQWRAAWILCETGGDLDCEAQRDYVRGATVDPEVERCVVAILEQLESEPSYPAAPDRRVGDTVGRYTLLERIGQGGMGEVYSAEDSELRRTVALKFLPSAVAPDKAAASHVISEARLASRLNHPNIVTVYELLQTPWGLAMAMELVEGQSLRALSKTRRLSARETIQIGRQISSALAAAHEKGIVHRDIKPENVMVRADGYVKVLDFGLAQNIRNQALNGTHGQLPVGTVRYMSPEQKRGEQVTGASDVYSLAIVLEEVGNWRHPLLSQMRSAVPEQRPTAGDVVRHLEKLEKSSQRPMLAASIIALALLGCFLLFHFANRTSAPPDFRLRQLTSYEAGHDVTVAALSPDGERLAYATVDGGLIVRTNGKVSPQELDGPPGLSVAQLLFSSASSLLAVGINHGVFETWLVPLNGGAATRLLLNTQFLAVSHDGKHIAWLNDKHEIWTGSPDGTGSSLLFRGGPEEGIGTLFWSADDKAVWFNLLYHCPAVFSQRDILLNPDTCEESDLVSQDFASHSPTVQLKHLRLNSGFFADDGQLFFLREEEGRQSSAGFNLWSLEKKQSTGSSPGKLHQLSHLKGVLVSQLTGSRNGQKLAAIRTDSTSQTYVADWQITPSPSLRNQRRLTLEETNSFPHAWTPDGQSIIFESDRNGHLEIFRQNLARREAELIVSEPGDVYMPQVTPDGKWLLMMHRGPLGSVAAHPVPNRMLLRAPLAGGQATQVPLSQPLDEFRCGLPGQGTRCVLRTTQPDGQHYFELDPLAGEGRELGTTRFISSGLGRWALSPDGTTVVCPDTHQTGRFLELHLDPDPSKRSELWRHVEGIGRMGSISLLTAAAGSPRRAGWLATSPMLDPGINRALLPFFGDFFRADGLFYIDANLHAHLIAKSLTNISGVVSPNGKRMALLGADITSNVWSLETSAER